LPSGVIVRFWAKGHRYELEHKGEVRDIPSVTTVKPEPVLSWWGQRTGVKAMLTLFNTRIVFPVNVYIGGRAQLVMGYTNEAGQPVVAGEEELEELIKKHFLDVNHVRDTAGDRGQSAHDALTVWAMTGDLPDPNYFPPSEQLYVTALRNFLIDTNPTPVANERLVASWKHGYAGRYDIDVMLDKTVRVLAHHTPSGQDRYKRWVYLEKGLHRWDLKTSKDVYQEHGEQLEAYEVAAVESGYDASLERSVIHINAEGQYKCVPVSRWATFDDFKTTLDWWYSNESYKIREREARARFEKAQKG
jgi:hypothetical protein